MKKFPPIEKIMEAYTAIGDHHVKMFENYALVTSSNNAKTYTVKWHDGIYQANDNATYWQGYAGYPIIAVLLLQNKLPFDEALAKAFAGINWHELNEKFKRNYTEAAKFIFKEKKLDENTILTKIDQCYAILKELPLTIKRTTTKVIKN
ncbi:hypothetical protein FP435_03610 [Lactobacillus sp. PV037]|uniref:hypothetical protein n=1 Tax=unclassified Lactobacillus TaxID=2620435 RepID=UPI00223FFE0F|nr:MULTISPECIES: hypothetical protein [unclassified Lactobacillus]QNQ82294.1 hypothetical protein FP433_04220 [Lactobacillus sp. PV012]QNQ83594.1 hypothetical protein FP435_03610 [Lactobacillus sp. PV037]